MVLGDGDGFVRCSCGRQHWGLYGAAGLLVFDPARGVLLQRRAWWTHHGHTWAMPGGAVSSAETPELAALREATEEAGVAAHAVRLVASSTVEHGSWRYTTVLAHPVGPLGESVVSDETAELRWVAPSEVDTLPLHAGFAGAWPALVRQLGRELVLVVDLAELASLAGTTPVRDLLRNVLERPVPAGHIGVPEQDGWVWWPRVYLVNSAPEWDGRHAVEPDDDVRILDVSPTTAVRQARAANPASHVAVATADAGSLGDMPAESPHILDLGAVVRVGSLRRSPTDP